MNKAIKLILFLLGLLILFFLVRQVGFSEIVKIISQAKLFFLFSGIIVYLLLIFTRSLKWFLLIRIIKREISYKQVASIYLINSLIGNLTPFKSGEAVTPFLFKKYLKIPVGQGFSIVLLDRLFEIITFTIILVLAVLYVLNSGIQNSLILPVFQSIVVVLFLLIILLIILVSSKKITLKILGLFGFLRRFSLSKKGLDFVKRELDIFYNALSLLKNKGVYRFIIPLTLAAWFLEILASYLIFNSVFSVSFINIAVAQAMAATAAFVTFIPGGIGIAEVSWAYILSLFGYPLALSASGALLARLSLTGILIITGLTGFILIRKEKHNV